MIRLDSAHMTKKRRGLDDQPIFDYGILVFDEDNLAPINHSMLLDQVRSRSAIASSKDEQKDDIPGLVFQAGPIERSFEGIHSSYFSISEKRDMPITDRNQEPIWSVGQRNINGDLMPSSYFSVTDNGDGAQNEARRAPVEAEDEMPSNYFSASEVGYGEEVPSANPDRVGSFEQSPKEPSLKGLPSDYFS